MKVVCGREVFANALQSVIGAVPGKTSIELLYTVQLIAENESLEIRAVGVDLAMKTVIPNVTIEEGGKVNLLASKLLLILKKTTGDTVSLKEEESKVVLKIGKSKFSMVKSNPDEFPLIVAMPEGNNFKVNCRVLVDGIQKTVFATSKDSARYTLQGVLFDILGNTLNMVGTDSKRLSLFSIRLEEEVKENIKAIIPVRFLQELQKLMAHSETVEIAITNEMICGRTPDGQISGRIIDGNFPPYNIVTNSAKEKNGLIVVKGQNLENACEQSLIVMSATSRKVKVTLRGQEAFFKSESSETGESEIVIPLETEVAEEVVVGVNSVFLLEFLRSADSPDIKMLVKGGKDILVFFDGDREDYFHFLMPMAID